MTAALTLATSQRAPDYYPGVTIMSSMQSVLFVDSSVENSQVLLANLQPGIQVHRLSSGSSGVEQITKILRCQYADTQIGQIHLVSHGSPGCLYLGNSELSLDSIDGYTNQLKAWFHVSLNPQLLIYGCKVALGDAGSEFVNKLRHITGAEVAASTTLIGSSALGGNWDLDVVTGQQKVSLVFSENIQAAYAHVLEGTKQLSPAATDILALSVLEQGGTGEAFAGYNAPATRRLNIHIADPANEVVYLGFSKLIDGLNGAETTTPYYFRIKDPNGNIVKGPIKIDPSGSAGSVTPNLTSHAQAVAGPSAITGGGYNVSDSSWTFDPSGPAGDYYIEFDFNDTATVGTDGVTVGNNINIKWFDITVADTSTTTPTAIEGRVWSKAWQFRAQEVGYGTFDEPFNGKIYTYDSNQLVTEVDFAGSGFKPLQFNLSFNDSGPGSTGNIANDRRSVIGSALNPEHKVFLNTPDSAIFPKETLGSFVGTSFKVDDTSNPQIEVTVTKPGLVELILDFDQNGSFTAGTDVRLIANVTAGKNLIPWNGKNGAGVVVSPASYPISVIATYGQGVTNFTAYDVEGLDTGFKVIDATNSTAKLFWDDSNISVSPDSNPADDVKVNVDIGATKRQTWSTTTDGVTIRNYGNGNTINTWWYANRVVTTGLVAANKPPIVDLDGNVAGTDFSVSFVEGNAAVAIADTDALVTDIDDTTIESATITLTNRLDGVLEVLAVNGVLPAGIAAVNYNTTTGVLKLIGSATLADYQTAIAQIQYNNTSDSPNTANRVITVKVNDGILDSNLATSTITIQPSNDPPTVDLNGSSTGTDYNATFIEGNAAVAIATNTATLNDPDGTDIETLILSLNSIPDASNEVLNVGGQAIALTNGAANATVGTTTFAITATNGVVTIAKQGGGDIPSADIQTLLRGITYQNNSDAPTGSSRVITVKVNDGSVDSNLATSTITIQPTNDPPSIDLDSGATGTGYVTTFQEGNAAVAIAATTTAVTDADDTNIESAIVTLTNPASGDVLSFNGTPVANNTTGNATGVAGLTFAVSTDGATLTFSGSATKAEYETALKAIAFSNTSDNPTAGNRSITVVVKDGDANSNTATSTITVTPVNDPPILDLDGSAVGADYSATYTENAIGVAIAATTTAVTDVDDTNIESAIVTLTNPASGDLLSFSGTAVVNGSTANPTGVGGLTFAVSANGSTLTFSGSATKAQYETVLKAIAFSSTSDNPLGGNRTITVVVNDGDANSNIASSTITVTPINDPPAIDLNGAVAGNNYSATYTENAALGTSIVGATTAATDADDANLESAIVTLTNPSSGDLLSFSGTAVGNGTTANPTGVAGLTFAVSADGSTLTFSGSATKTEYETVLKAIAFQNTLDNPVGGNRTITVVVKDGDANSNIATSTITVTPVNDAPTIDLNDSATPGADYSATYTENTAAVAVTNTAAATIADLDGTDINTLTLNIAGLKDGVSEVLSIGGKPIVLSGTVSDTVTVGGTTFAIAATNGIVTLTKSGGGDIPSADLQTLLRGITYQNTKPSPTEGNRTISWLANDGTIDSNLATSTINILRDRDADGILDTVDLDDDNDGILDTAEEQGNPNRDTDGDSIPDRLDLDADNDGITDIVESGLTPAQVTALDSNGDGRIDSTITFGSNGFADPVETTPGSGTAIYGKPVDTDSDTRPDFQDLDADNDGINDVVEAGGKDLDGNGLVDGATTDTDKDGLANAVDPTGSPGTPLTNPDTDTDGIRDFRDLDSDNDGLPDLVEGGLNPVTADVNGDGVVDGPDGDSDGIQNAADGTPTVFGDGNGPASDKVTDTDGDKIPDYREVDSDNDTIPDRVEAGLPQGPTSPDGDRNGVADNPIDTDKDGIADAIDSKPGGFGGFEDTDKDGIANFKDLDDDNDGILDTVELAGAPTTGPNIGDTDGDGILDSLDLDADNDGINDVVEARHGGTDSNGDGQVDGTVGTDGIPDIVQATANSGTVKYGNPVDSDTDGKADFQDLDSDNDSLSDLFEGGSGGTDANDNGVIDGPDADGDGILDSVDGNKAGFGDSGSPVPPNSDADPNPDYLDVDSNADGVKDIATTGNGLLDANKDGVIDSTVDLDKDGIRDVVDDSDLDGTPDVKDTTPNPSFGGLSKPDTDKDGISDTVDLDDDNDGILDTVEELGNPIRDTDKDGILDRLDLDADNDGIPDLAESGLTPAQIAARDSNGDGRIDPSNSFGTNGFADLVETTPGSGTAIYGAPLDTDGDTRPDFQDLDSDNDGLNDVVEAGGADTDGNGLIDGAGTDADGDGLANVVDPSGSPGTPLPNPDSDSDGARDFRDLDSDNDGLPDLVEGGLNPQTVDLNGDGVVDGPDGDSDGVQNLVDGTPAAFGDNNGPRSNNLPNADGDSIPDYREPDSNNNGIPDRVEAGLPQGPSSPDANGNGVIDNPADADKDGIADSIDSKPGIFGGFEDTDKDGISNFKDLDDDNDGILDTVELAGAPTTGPNIGDTDGDGILDSLDLDADNDGILDVVEARHGGTDANGDGQVDGAVGTDGIPDGVQATPDSGTVKYGNPVDGDTDGKADFQDLDSDNDSLSDLFEGGSGGTDTDDNGVLDLADSDGDGIANSIDGPTAGFGDGNGYAAPPDADSATQPNSPDYIDVDSNNDGFKDIVVAGKGLLDVNGDGVIDNAIDLDKDGIRDVVDDSDLDRIPDSTDPAPNPAFGGLRKPDADGDGIADIIDLDDDNDGILDSVEENGNPTRDTDGDGVLDRLDLDADNDGILDVIEARHPGTDADGNGQVDGTVGTDGIPDRVQADPNGGTVTYVVRNSDNDPNPDFQDLDSDNDSLSDLFEGGSGGVDLNRDGVVDGPDSDGDGIRDSVDGAPGFGDSGSPVPPNQDSDAEPDYTDLDSDNDGATDILEASNGKLDTDGDGRIDNPTDIDKDGIPDVVDDSDLDGTPDAIDTTPNPAFGGLAPVDTDQDGIADINDLDDDNDGILDSVEEKGNPKQDTDGDGVLDRLDLDADNDGINDLIEAGHGGPDENNDGIIQGPVGTDGIPDVLQDDPNSRSINYGNPLNSDNDDNPDFQDLDSDNDSLSDLGEGGSGGLDANRDGVVDGPDTDGDGIQDSVDGAPTLWGDSNSPLPTDDDRTTDPKSPNYRDPDSNADGVPDIIEAGNGVLDPNGDGKIDDTTDADDDGIADVIDDSNLNGTPDIREPGTGAFGGLSDPAPDADGDGIPNTLDLDDDNDGILDTVEAATAPGNSKVPFDTDGDGIPDRLDLDSDNDGINDVIEAGHSAADTDGNGIIDGAPGAFGANGFFNGLESNDTATATATYAPRNSDRDAQPDFQDLDSDNDSLSDLVEGGSRGTDLNGDGVVDGPDADRDGIQDSVDGTPQAYGDSASPLPTNSDTDGAPDYIDRDSDDNGVDDIDQSGSTVLDPDDDGEIDNVTDRDNDGIADVIDDSDLDGIVDADPLETDPQGFGGLGRSDTDGDGILNVDDLDDDNDGILDTVEERGDIDRDTDGDGILDRLDLDSDNDGINDIVEAGHGQADADGNGILDGDSTAFGANGYLDALETVPESGIATYRPVNSDTDDNPNFQDIDSDNDSLSDLYEGGSGGLDADGNGVVDGPDRDGDGIQDSVDGDPSNFGDAPGPALPNTDGDPTPNYQDLDSDNDGSNDIDEASNGKLDGNGDGQIDNITDVDGDGAPDVIDDSDLDGTPDLTDVTPNPAFGGLGLVDTDDDGVPDIADLDDDNDGILDTVEARGNPDRDTDGDGVLDRLDLDADNDGINDSVEAGHGALDTNGDGLVDGTPASFGPNGYLDSLETTPESGQPSYNPLSSDGDANPDFQDLDSDNDSLSDLDEGGSGGLDANRDGIVDGPDSDGDGIQDAVDGRPNAFGDSGSPLPPDDDRATEPNSPNYRDPDRDADGLSDIIEAGNGILDPNGDGEIDDITDFDEDGIADAIDDSNGNGTPDIAEPGSGAFGGLSGPGPDADGDGIVNEIDLDDDNDGILDTVEDATAPATGPNIGDTDGDGIPDRLDLDSDNDGINDVIEAGHGAADADGDGFIDGAPAAFGANGFFNGLESNDTPTATANYTPFNSDSDTQPDFQDLDADNDGLSDLLEGGALTNGGIDLDDNGVLDGPDQDKDGIPDSVDGNTTGYGDRNSPPPPDEDGDRTPDFRDLDSNNDGNNDVNPNLDLNDDGQIDNVVDQDRDGIADIIDDSDSDGIVDVDPAETDPQRFGGLPATDTDDDGVPDSRDLDDDNDGILDTAEEQGNPRRDTDGDGIFDRLDLDADNDGIPDLRESGLSKAAIATLDTNGDGRIDPNQAVGKNGFADAVETAPESGIAAYGAPANTDGDGLPDFQDLDADNDGIADVIEGSAIGVNADPDGNGLIGTGAVPLDGDRDGLADVVDTTNGLLPNNPATDVTPLTVPDLDQDSIPDFRDLDADNDSFSDLAEAGNPQAIDRDGDGKVDGIDADGDGLLDAVDGDNVNFGSTPNSLPAPVDTSKDGIPDYRQAGSSSNNGTGGADIINGSDGDDILNGLSDNDTLDGGAGDDVINGGSEEDVVIGGIGNDILNGGTGNDRIDAGPGDDIVNGGSGDDNILGGDGADQLNGGSGNDTLSGGNGDDLLSGGSGENLLLGGSGDDTLLGGRESDILVGGAGNDVLTGGQGADTFRYESIADFGSTGDIITDFNLTTDRIDLSSLFNGNAVLGSNVQLNQSGRHTVLLVDAGSGLQQAALILNTNASTLLTVGPSNFIL